MPNTVPGVFPALVLKSVGRLAFIVDEPVSVMIGGIEPAEGALDVGTELVPESKITGPADVFG